MIHASEAILAVNDVPATIRFYRDILGFESEWMWGTPPTFGGVRLGKAHIMLCQQPKIASQVEGHMHMFFADAIDELYARHKAAGAPIVSEIENKPWHVREYTVRDLNGYHLRFGGPERYEKPATAADALPKHIAISVQTPSLSDYHKLFQSVNWSIAPEMPQVLERSLFCVLATDTQTNEVVGMTRACGDGRYFTLWDVIVMPAYQNQQIGRALLERAVEELRKIGPRGAFVGLFTTKPDFYERVGFRKDVGMHLAL
jgi:ribosomal protein S18 acetylase RimI-like enzyme